MEPYRIFISSIMNTATENLLAEREAARAAVEYFAPTTIAWAFENEPASPKPPLDFYINGVKSSDLFVLIVGQRLTKPVRDEFDTARDHGKPMLLFAKTVDARETAVNQLLHSANVKYDKFANATELRERIRRAVGDYLLRLIRGDGDEPLRLGGHLAQLRAYARTGTLVRVLPLVPATTQYKTFRVKSVEASIITLEKDSNRQSLTVPAQRVEDVMHAEPPEQPTVLLNGRLQWITILSCGASCRRSPLPTICPNSASVKNALATILACPDSVSGRCRPGWPHDWQTVTASSMTRMESTFAPPDKSCSSNRSSANSTSSGATALNTRASQACSCWVPRCAPKKTSNSPTAIGFTKG
jgi:hypothetical protein